MYVTAILVVYGLALTRAKKTNQFSRFIVEDYLFWAILGVVVGSRIGYVLFYDFMYFLVHPLRIVLPFDWQNGFVFTGISGLSFHGGVLGFIFITVWFCKKNRIPFFSFVDFIVPYIPLGYMFGRIGNFLNLELYGRVTQVPWGMYFPTAPTYELRHPSQLYEAFFEGLFLFVFLITVRRYKRTSGALGWWYLIGYGAVRFCIEFFRQPDAHIGLMFLDLSMGQWLCVAMILAGFIVRHYRLKTVENSYGQKK